MPATAAAALAEGPLDDQADARAGESAATGGRDRVLASLVARLHAEFGTDPAQLHRLAVEVLGTFATARIQAFVPILAEKRLREACRQLRPAGTAAHR